MCITGSPDFTEDKCTKPSHKTQKEPEQALFLDSLCT